MSTNWDYAQLAKTAKSHGGPRQFLDAVKAGSKSEGRAQGLLVGVAIGGTIAVTGYDYLKRKRLAAIAERELLHGMEAASEGDDPASDDY